MQFKLPFIGTVNIGEPTEKIVEVPVKEKGTYSGYVDLFKTDSKLSNYKSVSTKLLEANQGWVFKNNDAIAKEVGNIEFELFRTRRVGEEIEFIPILQHPLLDALDRFNEFTSATSAFYLTESHQNLAGDAFWYIDGKGININGIYLLQPDKVEVKIGDPTYGQFYIKAYEYKDTVEGKQVTELYEPDEIVHFKQPNPSNPYRGKSKVEAAAEEIDTDNLVTLANKRMYQRGLITNFVLSTDKHLTPEQGKAIEAKLQSNYGGADKAGRAMILSGGLEPKSIQITNRDMETIAQLKWLRDKIMSVFGNTPAAIGMIEDVNRASAEATLVDWKRGTIKSEMKTITDTINEFLLPRFGEGLILGFKDPVPEDRDSKVKELTALKNAKIITANEAREGLGYAESDEDEADELSSPAPTFNPDKPEEDEAIPKSVKNISFEKHLRKIGLYKQIKTYKAIRKTTEPIAKKLAKKKKVKQQAEVRQEHAQFTNEQVWGFHNKQIKLVDAHEDIFRNKVQKFIMRVMEKALDKVPEEVSRMQNKALFDEDELLVEATLDFRPLLTEVGILSAQHALNLVNDDQVYSPANLRKKVDKNVRKFAKSMVATDRDKIIDTIARGVAEGKSIPVITNQLKDEFVEYSKMQAERIARTEVIRASNEGAVDAWIESDVVTGKQWLTAEDDRVDGDCEEMNGIIVDLETSYNGTIRDTFSEEVAEKLLDYGSVEEPPLHPNCRCTLLPVLVDQKAFDAESFALVNRVKELENVVDKRTKEFKELKAKDLDKDVYIKRLETLANQPKITTE